jgi:hypothetical protein
MFLEAAFKPLLLCGYSLKVLTNAWKHYKSKLFVGIFTVSHCRKRQGYGYYASPRKIFHAFCPPKSGAGFGCKPNMI